MREGRGDGEEVAVDRYCRGLECTLRRLNICEESRAPWSIVAQERIFRKSRRLSTPWNNGAGDYGCCYAYPYKSEKSKRRTVVQLSVFNVI